MLGLGLVVKAAVRQRTAQTFVEEQEQQSHLNTFGCQTVGVTATLALEQTVAFEFAEIVAELVQAVGPWGKLEGGEDGGMNLFGGPAANGIATVQQDLQQADDASVMNLDSRISDGTGSEGQGQPLEQGKVHMDIQALRLKTGEAIRDDLESFPHGVEMIESFLEAEVAQVVGAKLVAEKAGNFSYCLRKAFFQ